MSTPLKPWLVSGVPRPRKRTWFALFLLAVGAIVGGVPGWRMVFASWMVFSWFLLACTIVSSLLYGVGHALERRWEPMRIDFAQAGYLLLAGAVFPLMFELPAWVDLVASCQRLQEEADVDARGGATRLAASHIYEAGAEGGTVFDPSGEIAKPVDQRSPQWHDGVTMRFWLDKDCLEVKHLVGPFYHWSVPCDRFL
jgi:hypothetical protein